MRAPWPRSASCCAYFLISIAAPVYLAKEGRRAGRAVLRPRNVVITVLACLCLLVPTVGSFYPVPPFPVNIFPYIFRGVHGGSAPGGYSS